MSSAPWADVCAIARSLRARQQLRGLGGELLRQAACHAAARLAAAAAPLHAARVGMLDLHIKCDLKF